jgi:hypothetical protein
VFSRLFQKSRDVSAQVAQSLEALSESIALRTEVEKATAELALAIYDERTRVEGALEAARRKRKSEQWLNENEEHRAAYEEEYARLSRLLDSAGGEQPNSSLEALVPPDFTPPPKNADRKIAEAIELKIAQLRRERHDFLLGIAKSISIDADLRAAFSKELESFGGSQSWSTISYLITNRDSAKRW